jgi:hypothetical protein
MKLVFNPLTNNLDWVSEVPEYKYPSGVAAGKYQNFFEASISYTTKAFDADYLVAYPVIVKQKCTIDKIRGGIATPAVGNIVYGVYNQASTGLPGTLLFQSTAFNTNVSGTALYTLPQQKVLNPGLYWMAMHSSSAAVGPATAIAGILANIWSDMSASQYSYYYRALPYSATMPSTFGTGSITTGYTTINYFELVLA